MSVTAVLFDLDGTLSNSAPGILASLRHALVENGLPPMSAQQERSILGPPFQECLPPIVGADHVDAVIGSYRKFYGAGAMFDAIRYEGIEQVLGWLRDHGVTLAVATSKPEHFAVPIVEGLALTAYFQTVCGDTMEGTRGSKALVVGEAVRRLGSPLPGEILMVGDRSHDVIGARAHGVACLGAGWGYGQANELADAGALAVFADPLELCAALPGLLSDGL
jgi:phosphoglycolate phosphatase